MSNSTVEVEVRREPVTEQSLEDRSLGNLLEDYARSQGLNFLLSYHEDGVVWGRYAEGWQLSSGALPQLSPPFRAQSFLEGRAFGESAELYLWREGERIRGYLLTERPGDIPGDATRLSMFQERFLLWGDRLDEMLPATNGFTPRREGRQGLRHALPMPNVRGRRVSLLVRHYIDYDDSHQAYIRYSRLVNLEEVP